MYEATLELERKGYAHLNLNKTLTKRICYILDCKKFSMEVCMHTTHNVFLPKSPKSNLSSLRMTLAEDDIDESFIVGSRKLIHQRQFRYIRDRASCEFINDGSTHQHRHIVSRILHATKMRTVAVTLRWKLGSCSTWSAADMTLDKVVDYIKREMNQFFHCS
ncbi:BTB/POZ domain-containing protein [Tanacetum coccineum]